MSFQMQTVNIINVYQKRGSCSDFKAEMYSWFTQRRDGTIASPFFCQKTVFLSFENIISPSQRTSRCRNWVTSPLAAKIYWCLTRCSFVFYAKQTTTFIGIFVYKIWPMFQLAWITQWQNTEFIYAEILNKTSLVLMFTSDILYIFFYIYYPVVYLCCISFYFVA